MIDQQRLYCSYDGTELVMDEPNKRKRGQAHCPKCCALFEENPGYGWFTSDRGENDPDTSCDQHSISTGEERDSAKPTRTPEGLMRAGSGESLQKYLERTQAW